MTELVKRKKRRHAVAERKIPLGMRVLFIILIVVLVMFTALAVTFHSMRTKGKKSLYNGVQSSGPMLPGVSVIEIPTGGASENSTGGGLPGLQQSGTEVETDEEGSIVDSSGGSSAPSGSGGGNSQGSASKPSNPVNGETLAPYEPQEGDVSYNGHIYRYNKDILTFLLLGIDSTETVPTGGGEINYMKGGQSDMMFLAVMNPHTNELSMIAINRNTMTDVDMYRADGSFLRTAKAQICVQHGYGDGKELSCERAKQTVSEMLYGLPIHGYCSIRLGGIMEVNDSVGGVTLTVKKDYEPLGYKAGETVTLDGDAAYAFLRRRDITMFDSATDRLNRQKLYLSALLKSVKEQTSSNISFPVTLYKKLNPYMVTNISVDEVTYLATEMLNYSVGNGKMYSLPGNTVRGRIFEEFYLDEAAVVELMLKVFYDVVK